VKEVPESVTSAARRATSREIVPAAREVPEEDSEDPPDLEPVAVLATTVASPAIWLETVRSPSRRDRRVVDKEDTMTEEVIEVVREEEVEIVTTVESQATSPRIVPLKEEVVREDKVVVDMVKEDRVVIEKEERLPVTTVTRLVTWPENAPRREVTEEETEVSVVETEVETSLVTTVDRLVTFPETVPPRNEEDVTTTSPLIDELSTKMYLYLPTYCV